MKMILAWIKANPLIVLSVALVVGSIGALVLVHFNRTELREKIAQRGAIIGEARTARDTSVNIPALSADQPAATYRMTMNQTSLDELSRFFGQLDGQYKAATSLVSMTNTRKPMMEGLFPDVPEGAVRFTIKKQYRRFVLDLLGRPQPGVPRLDATSPPTLAEINAALESITRDYLTTQIVPAKPIDRLNDREREKLKEYRANRVMALLRDRAATAHIYAFTPTDITNIAPDFPLDITAVRPPEDSSPAGVEEIWEGQMSLWIQQDIVQAIAKANRVEDAGSNILTAPVKRLIKVRVVPGYVGLTGDGGYKALAGAPALGSSVGSAGSKMVEDFTRSPSGRTSNWMFDVRHVQMTIVVDVQRLPEFFASLSKTNFMTVLGMDVYPVDEYQALQEGYVYGSGDVAKVDLLIETLWFRNWTELLMPRDVKVRLQIASPDAPSGSS